MMAGSKMRSLAFPLPWLKGYMKSLIATKRGRPLETRKVLCSRSLTCCVVVFVATIIVALVAEQILEYVEEKTLATNDTFIEFGGNKIRYLQTGPAGSGANVVFIAGMGHSLEESLPLAQEVSPVASTLVYDRGGRGFSHSDTTSVSSEVDELVRLLTAVAG
jgi:hypothetical protein